MYGTPSISSIVSRGNGAFQSNGGEKACSKVPFGILYQGCTDHFSFDWTKYVGTAKSLSMMQWETGIGERLHGKVRNGGIYEPHLTVGAGD